MTTRHRWPPLLATGLLLIAIAITILAFRAAANPVTVSASAVCVNQDGAYDVTATAHNTYTTTLHVMVTVPTSPIPLTLAPGQTWTFTMHVDHFQNWSVKFTSSDAELVGQTSYQFTYEGVCGAPPPPPSTTSSTTCDRANPPRTDCSPTTAPTQPSTTVPPPPASAAEPTTGPPDTTPVAVTTTVPGAAGHPTTTLHALPVTGSTPDWLVVLGVTLSAIGVIAVAVTTRRRAS